jgi:hypothetical protein
MTDPEGQVTTYGYALDNELASTTYSNAQIATNCQNEECLRKMYSGGARSRATIPEDRPNSNTFVNDLLSACGMGGNVPPGAIR